MSVEVIVQKIRPWTDNAINQPGQQAQYEGIHFHKLDNVTEEDSFKNFILGEGDMPWSMYKVFCSILHIVNGLNENFNY